ncbi:VOC family protein [Fretibacter rubidus]|uniref:VOC family protein n=1 Tax=Fretibacter rubidus TaxID=570162 RepID=UPI00352BBB29
MSTHHHFNYIELPTTDMAAMKAFYTQAFGWEYIDYGPRYAAIIGAGVDGGFDADAGARGPSKQGVLVILHSDDLLASEQAVKAAGGVISVPAFDFPGGRRFHFTDPSGNELGVWTQSSEG